jgi:hypothetical protein
LVCGQLFSSLFFFDFHRTISPIPPDLSPVSIRLALLFLLIYVSSDGGSRTSHTIGDKGAAIDALNAIPLAAPTVPVARALVGSMPPRNPKNDDDIDDEDEDDDEEADEDREPAVIREPDRDE